MIYFFLGLAPENGMHAFVSSGDVEVMEFQEFCSNMVPRDNGQKYLKSDHSVFQSMANRARKKASPN